MKLDRTNPLTKGLLYAKSFGNIYEPDSVSNASPIVVDYTTGVTQSSRYGSFRYLNCTGATGDYFDCNVSPTWSTGDELTVALLYRGHSGDEGSYIGQRDDTNIVWQIYNLTSSNSGETFNINIGNQTINQIGTSTVAIDGEWHLLHVCLKFGTEVQMFVDGVPDPWGVDSETRTPYSGAIPMSIGMRWATYPATGFEANCDVAFAGLWNRRLSAGEIANHAKNPWQVFRGTPIIGAHQLPEDVVWGRTKIIPWTRKPPVGTRLDFSNPLTKGLVTAIPLLGPGDLLASGGYRDYSRNNYQSVNDGTLSPGIDENGYFVHTAAADSISISNWAIPQNETTVLFAIKLDAEVTTRVRYFGATGDYECASGSTTFTIGNDFYILSGAGPATANELLPETSYWSVLTSAIKSDVNGNRVWTRTANNVRREVMNAVPHAGDTPAATGTFQFGASRELADGTPGNLYFIFVWDRQLSVSEEQAVISNPWQMFEPRGLSVPINEDLPELTRFEVDF